MIYEDNYSECFRSWNNDTLNSINEMVCQGTDLYVPWQNNPKAINIKALRELQQKRVMNSPNIKDLKRKCKRGNKYLCIICKMEVNYLQASHIGPPIMPRIRAIVERNPDTTPLYDLWLQVLEEEDKSLIIPVCCNCNKELESKDI